ncbi:PREDICTED: acid sphingomyelinase-like phosphodiesterase 3a isoform X1 [Papilio xuthus]|uniref:Acid sphingomyelinase-like phosphodiesterase 3a isoform X1 n=1 Tax=Papilio xuthus TaxID=66420 RepID=A0AAJ6ZDS4_PAPXU|nr:PREDICTED: acid sphingomyelinase-like phosphodiesterase 3a isoform X1 [Papilio xuthus]
MKIPYLLLTLTCVFTFSCTHAKIGYFWHITDFHYDPLYTPQGDTRRSPHRTDCRRADERGSSGHHRALGRYGDYSCDSSLELIESAAKYMRTRHSENVEFVLWTGDIIAARYTGNEDDRYRAIRNMTELLGRTFSSHFVFPVLGHLDPSPSETLTNLWMHWLPLEALQTFKIGGYYTIEQSHSKLRIVALNTNLFGIREVNSAPAKAQWEWLDAVLDKAQSNKEMVYIVGHAAPGTDLRPAYNSLSVDANAKYLRTIRRHAKIIAGQFFGHLHADTFRVIYDKDQPVSWALLAPSVSPHHDPTGSSNPGLRLYKFDSDTGKVLDYTQYYLDLAAANRAGSGAEWTAEYNLTQYYGLRDVSADSLHNLADKLRIGAPHETAMFNNSVLSRYLRAYNVKHESADNCDGACAHQHFCAITCLEHVAYRQCVEAAASALAASAQSADLLLPALHVLFTLIIILVIFV